MTDTLTREAAVELVNSTPDLSRLPERLEQQINEALGLHSGALLYGGREAVRDDVLKHVADWQGQLDTTGPDDVNPFGTIAEMTANRDYWSALARQLRQW